MASNIVEKLKNKVNENVVHRFSLDELTQHHFIPFDVKDGNFYIAVTDNFSTKITGPFFETRMPNTTIKTIYG